MFEFVRNQTTGDYVATLETSEFHVSIRSSYRYGREYTHKARVFVGGAVDVDFTDAYAMQAANAEAYGKSWYERGTFPEEDALFAKLNREVVKNEKAVLTAATAAFEDLAELVKGVKFGFHRNAGCSCGCSSGFIASEHITVNVADGNIAANVHSIFITKKVVSA